MNKLLKHFNGVIGFAVGTILFFAAPPLYRLIDPTAGAFDAGYIHPIIYACSTVCIGSSLAWALTRATAPGPWKLMDKFFDGEINYVDDCIAAALILYFIYMAAFVIIMVNCV